MNFYSKNSGQVLTEIVIGLAISGIVIATVAVGIALVLRSNQETQHFQVAALLAQEYTDQVRSISEGGWNDIYSKSPKGATSTYHVAASGTALIVVANATSTTVDELLYTRFFSIQNVCRTDSTGAIAGETDDEGSTETCSTSGQTHDPSTQKITIVVEWTRGGDTREVRLVQYITRWRNRVFRQTDWGGGIDEGPLTRPSNTYATSTNIDADSQAGVIILEGF